MSNNISSFKNNGYLKYKFKNIGPINLVKKIINKHFKSTLCKDYPDTDYFRNLLLICQDEINQNKVHQQIVNNEKEIYNKLLSNKSISIQSVVYLRGVRSNSQEMMEYLDYHRENFYCDDDYINHQLNNHIPIQNYNINTSMKIIDKSHTIDDDNITTEKFYSKNSGVDRFSVGHNIGLSYNPKVITDGVDISEAERIDLDKDEMFIFSPNLIHGGGINPTKNIRFSLDCRSE